MAFAINYGTGGIGAEVYANRIGVGPMGSCVDCKFEEFFLSAWSVGDPAMLVDRPANSSVLPAFTTPPARRPYRNNRAATAASALHRCPTWRYWPSARSELRERESARCRRC